MWQASSAPHPFVTPIRRIIDHAIERVRHILDRRRAALVGLADRLIEVEAIDYAVPPILPRSGFAATSLSVSGRIGILSVPGTLKASSFLGLVRFAGTEALH
jgi:hypothetical protein